MVVGSIFFIAASCLGFVSVFQTNKIHYDSSLNIAVVDLFSRQMIGKRCFFLSLFLLPPPPTKCEATIIRTDKTKRHRQPNMAFTNLVIVIWFVKYCMKNLAMCVFFVCVSLLLLVLICVKGWILKPMMVVFLHKDDFYRSMRLETHFDRNCRKLILIVTHLMLLCCAWRVYFFFFLSFFFEKKKTYFSF